MDNYIIPEKIKNSILEENISDLKVDIPNVILLKKNDEFYKAILKFIKESNSSVFEEDDGAKLKLDSKEWTAEYGKSIGIELISNFSEKKLKHFSDIWIYLNSNTKEATNKTNNCRIENENNTVKVDYGSSNGKSGSKSKYSRESSINNKSIGKEELKKIIIVLAAISMAVYFSFRIFQKIVGKGEKNVERVNKSQRK